MTNKELWTDLNEFEFQAGDMNAELFEPLDSGGKQGHAPTPPTKIKGTEYRYKQEKVQVKIKVNLPFKKK
jgi:hypothetical protein